jgi:hypothetical protein
VDGMKNMGRYMAKTVLILVCVMMVSGCGETPRKPVSVLADQKRKSVFEEMFRKQIFAKYPVEKIKLEFAKNSEIKPPALKGDLPDFKLEEWSPRQMEYKGKLVRKWIVKAKKSDSVLDYMYYKSMPDGWIIRPNRETIPDTFDKIINPQDCSVVRNVGKYVWQGKICGNTFSIRQPTGVFHH